MLQMRKERGVASQDYEAETLEGTLALERIEVNLFRGVASGSHGPRIFGGLVIGQALAAAYQTVEDRFCHSLHCYFLRPGDPRIPILYEVDRARDGGSFTTRRVTAIQH
ncbi:MAG: acyl-CoA thioesterase, partial [Caulobacteraceae bacterium]